MKSSLLNEISRIREVMGIDRHSIITENKIILRIIGTAGVKGTSKWGSKAQTKYVTKMLNDAVSNATLIKELRLKGLINDAEEILPDRLAKMPAEQQGKIIGKILMTQANFVDAFASKLTDFAGDANTLIDPKILSQTSNVLQNNLGIAFDASDLIKLGDEIFGDSPNLIQLAVRKGNKNFPKYFFTRGGFGFLEFKDFGLKAMQDIFDANVFGKTDLDNFLRDIDLDKTTSKKVKTAFSNGKAITDTATQEKIMNALLADSDYATMMFNKIRDNKKLRKLVLETTNNKNPLTIKNIKEILGDGVKDVYGESLIKALKEDPTWLKILKVIVKPLIWKPLGMRYPLSVFLFGYATFTVASNMIGEWVATTFFGAGDKGKPNDALDATMYQKVMEYPYLAETLSGLAPSEAKSIAGNMKEALDGYNLILVNGTYDKNFQTHYKEIPTILGWSMVTHFYEKDSGKSLKDGLSKLAASKIPWLFRKTPGMEDTWLYDFTKENVYKDIKLKPYATTLETSADDEDMLQEIEDKWPKYPAVLYADDDNETEWYRLRNGHIPPRVLGVLLQSNCDETLEELDKGGEDNKITIGGDEQIKKIYKDINNCIDQYDPVNFNASYNKGEGATTGAYSTTKPSEEIVETALDLKNIIKAEDDTKIEEKLDEIEAILKKERGG